MFVIIISSSTIIITIIVMMMMMIIIIKWWWWWLFPGVRGFWEVFDNAFPACAFFSFFFLVEISSQTLIPLFRPGSAHSGSAN